MARGKATGVLFAELIGAAELYASAGDTAAHGRIAQCTGKLGEAAAACGARVAKIIDSRVMVLAESPDAAASAAIAMQLTAVDFPADGAPLTLGVGLDYGTVIVEGGDAFGDTVNLAARLVEQAAPGQILLVAETAAALRETYRSSTRRLYSMPIRGLSEDVALCELMWRADQAPTVLPAHPAAEPPRAKLRIEYRGRELVLRRNRGVLTIGRDAACDLVIGDGEASRRHCTIQQRHDHFVIADCSTNGTYVTVEGEGEVLLQREELMLRRHGWIALGSPRSAGVEPVAFSCD